MHEIALDTSDENGPRRVVVIETTARSIVEAIGSWDAGTAPEHATLDEARLKHWVAQGASPSMEVQPVIAAFRRAQLEAMRRAYEKEVQIQNDGAADEFTEI